MVTAREQIQQARQQLQIRRKQIKRTTLAGLTAAQVRRQTRAGIIQRKLQARQLETAKGKVLEQLKPFEKQIKLAESEQKRVASQIAEQNKLRQDLEVAKKFAGKPQFFQYLTKSQREIAVNQTERIRAQKQLSKTFKAFEAANLKPIVVNGKITGFEDLVGLKSIPIESVGSISLPQLQALERDRKSVV